MSLDWGNKVYIFDESLYFYDCVFYNRNLDKTKAMCKKKQHAFNVFPFIIEYIVPHPL